jgi:hypothetical protein
MADPIPFNARCGRESCQHVWTVAYLPMPLHLAAELMAAARCPKCASRDDCGNKTPVFVAGS